MIDISIKIDGKQKSGGMMGMSLEDMLDEKPVIVKKAKKKRKKKISSLQKAINSAIPIKSEYTTETV
jgi:hypothetical protein